MGEILERLQKLENKVEENKQEEKKMRLPFAAKVGNGKAKKNWIGVLKINENGVISPGKQQIQSQVVMVDGVPRLATGEYILRWKMGFKTYPIIIQPSWSMKPFSPAENFEASIKENFNTKGRKILLDAMRNNVVENKKKMSGMLPWIIGLGLLGLVGYAFYTGAI